MQVFAANIADGAFCRPRWTPSSAPERRASFGPPELSGNGRYAAFVGVVCLSQRRQATAAKARDMQKSPKEEFHDVEFRILHEHLQELEREELVQIASEASVELPKQRSKRTIILRLLAPQSLEAVRKVVSPKQPAVTTMSPKLLRKVQLHAAQAANSRPNASGQRPVAGYEGVQSAEQAPMMSGRLLQICNVHQPLQSSKAQRKKLQEVKVGDKMSGRVVEVSLLDGIRIDIGVEVDALVPVRIKDNVQLLEEISETYRLGSTIEVEIEDVSQDQERRFPITCRCQRQVVDLPDWQIAGKALQPHDAGTHSLRGREEVELGQSDDWKSEETQWPRGDTTKNGVLKDVPQRQPPEVVMSIGSGKVEAIQVPETHREAKRVKQKPTTRKAWELFMQEQLASLRLELHCRQRLARELAGIEAQLLRGNAPAVPAELLGLTLLPSGRGCLLPVPDGDCLKFTVREFDSAEDLHDWIETCHSNHRNQWSLERSQVDREGPSDRQQLAKFFACADAWHARAVEAAEVEEIRKLQYQNLISSDSIDDATMADLEAMVSNWTTNPPNSEQRSDEDEDEDADADVKTTTRRKRKTRTKST